MGKKKDTGNDEAPATRSRLTPIDVQQKEFRVSRFGGYKMRDVDEFLDHITDTFTALTVENDRLRTGAAAPVVGSPDLDSVARQADEIIARARAEAARITGGSKEAISAAAASTSGPTDRAAVNAFLSREREFLQSLAGLVQEHAEAVKGMAKSTRPASGRPSAKPALTSEAVAAETTSGEATAGISPAAGSADAETIDARSSAAPESARPESARPESARPESVRVAEPSSESEDVEPSQHGSSPSPQDEPTTVPEPEPTVRLEEPATAGATRSDGDPEADRSLRELFWGED
jgi:DivIVA domain-containing protein